MGSHKWTAADLPSLDGRTFVVTGANSGLGLSAARELGRAGARVMLAVRDIAKGGQAARTIAAVASPLHAYAAHPGYAATNLQNRTENLLQNTVMAIGNMVIAQSDEMGALPTLYAATQKLPGASYVGPDGFQEQWGHPTLVGRSSRASDAETARALWERSEALTGVSFPLTPGGA